MVAEAEPFVQGPGGRHEPANGRPAPSACAIGLRKSATACTTPLDPQVPGRVGSCGDTDTERVGEADCSAEMTLEVRTVNANGGALVPDVPVEVRLADPGGGVMPVEIVLEGV